MDGSNEVDEQRFLRQFSKQLASALRAKDEEEAEERERLRGASSGKSRSLGRNNDEWEKIRSTYVELCHDEPIISGGDGDCRRLAKALIPKQSTSSKSAGKDKHANKLALSSRLVDGILQATSRAGEKAMTSSSNNENTTQNNQKNNAAATDTEQDESMFGPSSVTTSEGYAEIAFAIFVEGPYRCIQQADNLQTASSFLGSFTPRDPSNNVPNEKLAAEEKSRLVDEATAKIVSGIEKMAMEGKDTKNEDDASSSSSEFFHSNKAAQDANQFDDNDSMKEVFAEDSDPDDFDFGDSSYNPYSSSQKSSTTNTEDVYDDMHGFGFNPLQLSEPNASNQTWEGARQSIHYLLSSLSYGKLVLGSLSSRAWSEDGVSETLADLSFMLLLENTNRGDDDAGKIDSLLQHQVHHDDGQDGLVEDIAALWDRPLFLLRDRALDKNRGHDALPSYLQLLTAFISHSEQDVMSILSSPLGKSTSDTMLPPATAVGLSSLASLCSSKDMISASSGRMCGTSVWSVCPREEMTKAILSALSSVARIVECVRPRKSIFAKSGPADESTTVNAPWIRTAVCIIPIIEYLTNLQARFDFRPLFEGGGNRNASLSESDAKAISDSGLFREMLSMYTTTRNDENCTADRENPNAEDVVRLQLLRTIFTLSAQSPEVLGRYAVRVPDFAKEVHSSTFMEHDLVDGILWTSIGSSLLENKSDALNKPRLKLRTNSKLKTKGPLIETKSMAERGISGFETMCDSSKKALEDLKQFVQSAEDHALGDEEKKGYGACKVALGNIKRFSNCLSNCPSATTMWLDSLKNKDDATQKAGAKIAELKSALATLPSFSDEEIKISHRGHKKDDDDRAVESAEADEASPEDEASQKIQTLKQIRKEYGTIVASVRSSVKVIALALESQKGAGLSVKGPMPYDVSSKTD